jgi:hypothetical protein
VAKKAASIGIPAMDNIPGFTARMYAIVRNVVNPANNSVLTFVPFFVSLKIFSNIKFPFRGAKPV